jgi:GNAT superfamily N-acetyltransferase
VNLDAVRVRPVARSEEPVYRQLMAAHHYLSDLPKIGHSLWYVATYDEQWVALLGFSAAAWKCAVRDRWIGWDFHRQYDYDRLKLIANNSRFLILPDWHRPNLGSKILSLCQKRLSEDWQQYFGHRLLLLAQPSQLEG